MVETQIITCRSCGSDVTYTDFGVCDTCRENDEGQFVDMDRVERAEQLLADACALLDSAGLPSHGWALRAAMDALRFNAVQYNRVRFPGGVFEGQGVALPDSLDETYNRFHMAVRTANGC